MYESPIIIPLVSLFYGNTIFYIFDLYTYSPTYKGVDGPNRTYIYTIGSRYHIANWVIIYLYKNKVEDWMGKLI